MLILTCPGHLRRLEEALRRSLPATLPVLGTVMTVARGNPASHEVLVDSWPHFSVVLTRLRPEENKDPGDFYTNQLTAYYRDEGAWRALLGGTEAVGWTRAFQIHGKPDTGIWGGGVCRGTPGSAVTQRVPNPLPGCSSSPVPSLQGVCVWGGCTCRSPRPPHPNLSTLPCSRVPPGLRLAPVSPSHIPLLNATWAFGGNTRSRRFLLRVVQALPSACLLAPHGRPVSWSLLDPLGTLSHGYTLPAWRGQGLSGVTLGALGRVLHARGFPIYCGVLPHNTPSQRAVRAVGFLPQPGTFYTLVVTLPTQ
uniref:Glycine N-acyltransferase-like protein n=1 Tax=Strix occidentalis caurina TaxID=311401 RepID=A0A8D0F9I5_STROC